MIAGIPGIQTIAMTTNGTLLAPLAVDLADRGLSSVNISLDTLDPVKYAMITRGGSLDSAIAGVRAAREAGLPVKLNVVVGIDTDPGALDGIRRFADANGCAVQTILYYRLDEDKYDDLSYDRPLPCAVCDRIRLLATGELRPCLHGDDSIPVDWNDVAGSIRACVDAKPICGTHTGEHLVSAIGG
mgnify:CR=1 FL=1